jgi:hypothetical protein
VYHQCRFRCNSSATDHIFWISQIFEKKLEYNEAVHKLCVDFKKAYDQVKRKVLYITDKELDITMKLVR